MEKTGRKNKLLWIIFSVLVILLFVADYNFLDGALTKFVGVANSGDGTILTTNPKVVCAKGYSASVRNVPLQLKKEVYKMNGVPFPQPTGSVELDHVVSLELGGSNSIKNLQIEYKYPFPGYPQKDLVENYLHRQVCSGQMKLTEAQDLIRYNWTGVYFTYINKSGS